MIFLEPNCAQFKKKNAVTVEFLHCANHARTHAYDLLGLYHKDKHSTVVSDLV